MLGVGRVRHLAAQQVAAAAVDERQRVDAGRRRRFLNEPLKSMLQTSLAAAAANSGPPGGPRRLIRGASPSAPRGRRARRSCSPPATGVRAPALERRLHLRRSPGRMLAPQRETGLEQPIRHGLRIASRRPRPVGQPGSTLCLPPSQPLAEPLSRLISKRRHTADTCSSPASTASTKRARSSMTRVSLHGIGKVLLADRMTCHPCRRSECRPCPAGFGPAKRLPGGQAGAARADARAGMEAPLRDDFPRSNQPNPGSPVLPATPAPHVNRNCESGKRNQAFTTKSTASSPVALRDFVSGPALRRLAPPYAAATQGPTGPLEPR